MIWPFSIKKAQEILVSQMAIRLYTSHSAVHTQTQMQMESEAFKTHSTTAFTRPLKLGMTEADLHRQIWDPHGSNSFIFVIILNTISKRQDGSDLFRILHTKSFLKFTEASV